jgi:beta-aspartyl-peptidase (threonine type)
VTGKTADFGAQARDNRARRETMTEQGDAMRCAALCLGLVLTVNPGDGDERAIRKVLNDQVAAWNQGDLKGFMAGYHKSDDITFYSGDKVLKGWDAMYERYQKKYQGEGKEMGKLSFRDLDVQVLGGGSAVVRGRWELKMQKGMPGGLFTLLLRKTADGWRIVHDHTSAGE